MKKNNCKIWITSCFMLAMWISAANLLAQTPGGINYQGVALRNTWPFPVNSQLITLKFTIREKTINGNAVYSEIRNTTTDSFGVFSVVIGAAGAVSQSDNIRNVKWSDTTSKFLQVELNVYDPAAPGFVNMGTTQLLSVPFSFYSDISDSTRIASKSDSSKFANGSGKYFFSATIPGDYFQAVPNDDEFNYVVKFPTVTENEGNVFNPVTSVFTSPDSGYYQFEITGAHLLEDNIPTNNNDWSENATVILMKNTTAIKVLHEEFHSYFSSGSSTNKHDEGLPYFNTQVKVKLAKNDQVSVRINAYYTNFATYLLGWYPSNYNPSPTLDSKVFAEFSGYKIK